MSNRFGFYGVLGGITLALLVAKLSGCASPASANNEIAPSTVTIESCSWTYVRENSEVIVVTAPAATADTTGADALSAPIVSLNESDPLLDAGLQVGDEILATADGFNEPTVVRSHGSLDLAYQQIESTINSNDGYLDVLVRRNGSNWWITVAVMPTT